MTPLTHRLDGMVHTSRVRMSPKVETEKERRRAHGGGVLR
jgi:hypothetical protein